MNSLSQLEANQRATNTTSSSFIGLSHPLPQECVFGETFASNGLSRPLVVRGTCVNSIETKALCRIRAYGTVLASRCPEMDICSC
jgi:hypothetical protein